MSKINDIPNKILTGPRKLMLQYILAETLWMSVLLQLYCYALSKQCSMFNTTYFSTGYFNRKEPHMNLFNMKNEARLSPSCFIFVHLIS